MAQQIIINGEAYEVIDAREYMTIPDCFVVPANKTGGGHGEAKFYVGNENEETIRFFDDFTRRCFLLKSDLKKYLEDAKFEYTHPEQDYVHKEDLPGKWKSRMAMIENIKDEIIPLSIYRVSVDPPRVYINSKDEAYNLLREIPLPQISYLSGLKLRSEKGEILYYFKLFVDYHGEEEHPTVIRNEEKEIAEDTHITQTARMALIWARMGQGPYREKLLQECPACIVTGVTDERILIASHIKPWSKCNHREKIDPNNGFMLTPTYDKLFDKGFISFEDDGIMLISPWISPMNQKRLNLSPRKKYNFNLRNREKYLKYHRDVLFKSK